MLNSKKYTFHPSDVKTALLMVSHGVYSSLNQIFKKGVLEFLSKRRNCKTLLYANTLKKTVLFTVNNSRLYVKC